MELSPDDAAARVQYGLLLVRIRKAQEAVAEFTRAAELEPYYAAPHLMLALLERYAPRPAQSDAGQPAP